MVLQNFFWVVTPTKIGIRIAFLHTLCVRIIKKPTDMG